MVCNLQGLALSLLLPELIGLARSCHTNEGPKIILSNVLRMIKMFPIRNDSYTRLAKNSATQLVLGI